MRPFSYPSIHRFRCQQLSDFLWNTYAAPSTQKVTRSSANVIKLQVNNPLNDKMLRGEHLTASSALRTRQESYGAGSGCCGADGAGAAVVGAANEQSVGLQNVSTFCCSCSWPAAANALSFCNLPQANNKKNAEKI